MADQEQEQPLVILSGEVTADQGHTTELDLGHAGIQDTFFTPLKVLGDKYGQRPRTQIVVCNYDTMSHENVWINTARGSPSRR